MKFALFSVTALVATFLAGFTHAGIPDEKKRSLRRHREHTKGNDNGNDNDADNGGKPKDNNDTIDLIVKYKNGDASQCLRTCVFTCRFNSVSQC
mmetsp:Transcript_12070/g.17868  ORF Transcript_12070/g.17868 Transcript_12070/m.17868 type:complete len:94 (+) Transcript_12070:109-390(+)